MRTIQLTDLHKARIWIGDLPELQYELTQYEKWDVDAITSSISQVRRCAVELYLPIGARSLYGLLGAEYTPSKSHRLTIQVAVTTHNEELIEWALAKHGKTSAGLPREYVPGILDGATQAKTTLGSGLLDFKCAAHNPVGSSIALFSKLSSIVVDLLTLEERSISEHDLKELIRAHFVRPE